MASLSDDNRFALYAFSCILHRMSSPRRHTWGYLLVLIAACSWATIGLFYRALVEQFHLTRGVVVAYRVGIPALILLIVLGALRPHSLHVQRRDWLYFASFGCLGVAAFYQSYIEASTRGPIAVASVLLYTAPLWITLWSVARLGEPLTRRKVGALLLAISGCALVANIFDRANLAVNGSALLFGVLSGLGYAAYSVWSAEGTRRGYSSWTVVLYSLGIGAVVLFAMQPLRESLRPWSTPGAWPYLLGVALGPTLLAPLCFTYGLRFIRTSSASILATVEPVLAALLGWIVLVPPEPLNGWQLLGGACVLVAVIALTLTRQEPMAAASSEPRAAAET